jgi:hypothetical protein
MNGRLTVVLFWLRINRFKWVELKSPRQSKRPEAWAFLQQRATITLWLWHLMNYKTNLPDFAGHDQLYL